MSHFALNTFGPDQPGTLARVAQVLADLGCNLEDLSATILRGHAALMMVVRTAQDVRAETLREAVAGAVNDMGISVHVEPCLETKPVAAPTPTHVLSVYGADRPGIVQRITALLAQRGVNLTDLDSRLVGDATHPSYAMLIEMRLPGEGDAQVLGRDIGILAQELGVDASLQGI